MTLIENLEMRSILQLKRQQMKAEEGYLIHQPDLLQRMENIFEEEVKGLKNFPTPSGEGFRVNKVNEGEDCLSDSKQNRYRSGIGLSLYLSRYSRPDICNATRELSKGMVKANEAHYKQMLRLIRYILTTKELYLKQTMTKGP